MTRRVLVVDDEENIAFLIESALQQAGYETCAAGTGAGALDALMRFRPDAMVLDVMLPDIDGFTLLHQLRGQGARLPVIFLTARDATYDRVRGLTIGGDDYMVKPFATDELVARVRLALQHRGDDGLNRIFRCSDLTIDDDAHRVSRAGEPISLSPTEYKLLHYLLLNSGRVVTRAQILDNVWDYDFRGGESVVDTYVSYLRRKIDHTEPKLIHTVRGVGYCLRAD